ncbi:unnamed protein product [Effrenium voratum]|nr:unnamed protein product [Effrenium voratum]
MRSPLSSRRKWTSFSQELLRPRMPRKTRKWKSPRRRCLPSQRPPPPCGQAPSRGHWKTWASSCQRKGAPKHRQWQLQWKEPKGWTRQRRWLKWLKRLEGMRVQAKRCLSGLSRDLKMRQVKTPAVQSADSAVVRPVFSGPKEQEGLALQPPSQTSAHVPGTGQSQEAEAEFTEAASTQARQLHKAPGAKPSTMEAEDTDLPSDPELLASIKGTWTSSGSQLQSAASAAQSSGAAPLAYQPPRLSVPFPGKADVGKGADLPSDPQRSSIGGTWTSSGSQLQSAQSSGAAPSAYQLSAPSRGKADVGKGADLPSDPQRSSIEGTWTSSSSQLEGSGAAPLAYQLSLPSESKADVGKADLGTLLSGAVPSSGTVKRTGASPQGRGVSRAASLQLPVRRFSSLKKSNTLDERDVRVRDLNLRFSERVDVVDISPAALSEEGHLVFVEGSPSPRTRSGSPTLHLTAPGASKGRSPSSQASRMGGAVLASPGSSAAAAAVAASRSAALAQAPGAGTSGAATSKMSAAGSASSKTSAAGSMPDTGTSGAATSKTSAAGSMSGTRPLPSSSPAALGVARSGAKSDVSRGGLAAQPGRSDAQSGADARPVGTHAAGSKPTTSYPGSASATSAASAASAGHRPSTPSTSAGMLSGPSRSGPPRMQREVPLYAQPVPSEQAPAARNPPSRPMPTLKSAKSKRETSDAQAQHQHASGAAPRFNDAAPAATKPEQGGHVKEHQGGQASAQAGNAHTNRAGQVPSTGFLTFQSFSQVVLQPGVHGGWSIEPATPPRATTPPSQGQEANPIAALARYLFQMGKPNDGGQTPPGHDHKNHSATSGDNPCDLSHKPAADIQPIQTVINCPSELHSERPHHHHTHRHSKKTRKHRRHHASHCDSDQPPSCMGNLEKILASSKAMYEANPGNACEGPEVTDEMVVTAQRGGLPPDLERRVLERAYFLFLNGVSDDQCRNYFEALRIELGQMINDHCMA